MEHEILDDEFQVKEKRNQMQFINWISLIILWIGIGQCGFVGITDRPKVIAAIVLLIISTITTFAKYELGVKITLGIILLGVLNFVDFSPTKYFISFGINAIEIGIEFSLFVIGIIHYFTNRKELSKFLKDLLNREISEEEIKSTLRSEINGFKRRFSTKEIGELEMIANNDELLPEAVKAAKELIEEKNKN
ncbi:MAG: hypothetical protein ACI97N_002573 [Cognaticolwellia sp.]|jgi:hypothetical protein